MVTVKAVELRSKRPGENFYVLILQGGVEMVKSKTTGRFYATIKEASVTTTFDSVMCESLIGTQMSGCIKRVECEAYEYTDKKTGEILTLHHRMEYAEEGETVEENIFKGEVIGAEA